MELDAPGDVVITDLSHDMSFGAELVEPAGDRSKRGPNPGELVLLIHGVNSHCANPNVRALAVGLAKRGARALAFDLPGYGACDGSFWDVRGQWGGRAKSLARIRTVLSHPSVTNEPYAIVGSSMGGAMAVYAANELMDAGGPHARITRVVLINPLLRMKTRFPTAVLWTLHVLSRFPILDKLEVSARPSDRKDGDKTMDFDESGQAQCDADELTWRKGVSLATGVELYGLTRANGDGDASEVSADECGLARMMRRDAHRSVDGREGRRDTPGDRVGAVRCGGERRGMRAVLEVPIRARRSLAHAAEPQGDLFRPSRRIPGTPHFLS